MRAARLALAALLTAIYATLGSIRAVSNALRDAGYLRFTVGVIFAAVAVGGVLALLRLPTLRSGRSLAGMVAVIAAYSAVTLSMNSPEERLHFIEYGVVALLAFASMPPGWAAGRRFLAAALFTVAAGWIDEGIQALLPERYYDLRDVAFNAAAGGMALGALALFRFIQTGPPRRP